MPPHVTGAVVFVDLDDTLWENARYFEQVVADFGRLAGSLGVAPDAAREELERREDVNIPRTGYGTDPFLGSVRETLARIAPSRTAEQERAIAAFLASARTRLRDHPIDLLPGAREGMDVLASIAPLEALTKGQPDEQTAKLARSPFSGLFRRVRVVPEKDDALYAALPAEVGRSPRDCWMIGNSPRSDVNPARRAGWRTVLVAHAAPWHRELEAAERRGPPVYEARDFLDAARHVATALGVPATE